MIASALSARMIEGEREGTFKTNDLSNFHNVGNMWLRVSNFGFFGSGSGPYPSLEYPGGSGIDYLYQGSLWFGAKKKRKNIAGEQLYWINWPPAHNEDFTSNINEVLSPVAHMVVDTLVSVGFDGDLSLYEFLPAFNPLEYNHGMYSTLNTWDRVITTTTRTQRRAFDDDGDGLIDEDPVGFDFPFRSADELPRSFAEFCGKFIYESRGLFDSAELIMRNIDIWFPLGFQELGAADKVLNARWDPAYHYYAFARPHDDDQDGLTDEDGAPISEQDFIGYYFDYSPFGTAGMRHYGSSTSRNQHHPLNLFVRQMSFAWSYSYIRNLVYVEFNITNMNPADTLFDCAMGIYIDADCGPQSWDSSKASDDVSGYYRGIGYEFAYSRDADGDGGLTPAYIGVRVCTPDPDTLDFSCWFWKVGDGPDDFRPLDYTNIQGGRKTANEKYWLLTGRNPDATKYESLRKTPEESVNPHFEQPTPADTRFLFAFYGDMNGFDVPENPEGKSWNLAPHRTMKIVVAVFPGDNLEDLKSTAVWAKDIYGVAQDLITVILPDTFPHYEPPEPPQFPLMFSELRESTPNNISLDIYWCNRSEYSINYLFVPRSDIGWNPGSGLDSDPLLITNWDDIPEHFRPGNFGGIENESGLVNPYTAWRLRHDFEGYSVWGRSGRGGIDQWMLHERYDKINTAEEIIRDYQVNINAATPGVYVDRVGDLGFDTGLPQPYTFGDCPDKDRIFAGHYMLGWDFLPKPIEVGDVVYGIPLYNLKQRKDVVDDPNCTFLPPAMPGQPPLYLSPAERRANQLLFKNPHPLLTDEIYLALVDDGLIPLNGHLGQNKVSNPADKYSEEIAGDLHNRLSRKFYTTTINNLPKGREYYVSVSAFNRGFPSKNLEALESGRDANTMIFFPGPLAKPNMDNIYVVPNPYRGSSSFDGYVEGDTKGDRGRRLWFVNLPMRCNVQIYTLAGDLVAEFEHNGATQTDILTISKAAEFGMSSTGMHAWNLLTRNNQIIASGLYFFSVKDHDTGNVKVGKFAVIR
jgi:hypothetical protein